MMKINFTPILKMKHSFFTALFLIFISTFSYAQCGFLDTCPNTDYFNFGMKSTTNAATLEYDNFTSSFHSTLVRTSTGVYKVWGEDMANDGSADLLSPVEMTSANFPALTGTILKAGLGSDSINDAQGIVLATDGLYAWSTEGSVLHADITTGSVFQKLTINGNSQGLPSGVTPTDVKMMFVTYKTIALVTCSGDVWVISQMGENTGTGLSGILTSATDAAKWYRVTDSTSGNLTNVVAVRGQYNTLFALKSDGTLWTWGSETYLGNNSSEAPKTRATQMSLPTVNPIKMIGVTRDSGASAPSYYVLNADGNLYALGSNADRQIGDWTTTERNSWVQPRYTSTSGQVMNDIHWISPNEHDDRNAAISVLTTGSKIYNWGSSSSDMLGRGTQTVYPGVPGGIVSTDLILAVETGGHTTMVSKKCLDKFGYVGHKINGSMGDGVDYGSGDTETSFTFNTAVVYVCGASTLDVQLTGSIVTGSSGKYCNTTSATLIPSPAGGTLALVSGPATLSGDVLTFTGTGNQTVIVSYTYADPTCGVSKSINLSLLTENCVLPPTITKTGTLTAFSACSGSVSAQQTFTVSGTDLTNNIVLTAPTGYEISLTTGGVFGSSLTLTQTSGTVTSTTIYVRIATTAVNGVLGNITLTSTGATTQNVAVIGTSNAIPQPLSITNSLCAANSLDWVTWDTVTTTTAAGTMNGIGVTVTQSNPGLATTPSMYTHTNFPSQYHVPNGTTISNNQSGTFTITFAQPINNPQVAFASIGQEPTTTVGITTSVPYSVIWQGLAMTYPTSTTMTGREGYTIISFPGLHSSITMTYDTSEYYTNIAFGAENTNCSNPIICKGDDITLNATGGAAYLWSPSTGLSATNTSSVIATPAVTTTYSVIDSSNACATAKTITVTVNPISVAGTITGAATVCSGTNSTVLTLGGYTGTIQWQSSTDNLTFTNIASQTGATYTATNLTATTYYKAVVTSGACAATTTGAATITVTPIFTPSALENQQFCYLTNPTISNLTTTTGIAIKWYSIPTGGVALSTSVALTTATTYYASQTVTGCESPTRVAVSVLLTCPVDAVADTFGPINGYVGSTTASVLANDTLNGVAVVPSQVLLTGTTVPTGLTLNVNGTITIAPLTPAGTYIVTYKICEVLNPTNCDSVTATVTVAAAVIDAVADTFGPINGYTGSTTASVLTNDTLNGVAVITSQVVLTGMTVPTGLTLNANGTITIAPLTPAGIYSVIYNICEILNPTNCDTVTTTVTVAAAVIDAVADTFGPINGYTGSTTASVLANDTLNGVAVVPSQVVLTGMTVPTGLTLNANGTITIAPQTLVGIYSVTYKICEVLNPTNCDNVTTTVTVAAAVIDAVADTFGPINGYVGSTTASVLVNDTLNGVAVVPSQVLLTGTTVPTGLTLNANGTITIAPLTPAGTYSVIYNICEVLNPTNCDNVTSTVTVAAAVIDAVADSFGPINGYTGSTTASVLANDTLNGVAVVPSQVVLTGMTVPTELTLNTNGTITIAPLTPAGTYSVTYKICEVLNPTNCDTVTSTVTVAAAVIDAVADTFGPINGYTGSTTASVLANDTLNGVAVIPLQVVLTGMAVPTELTLNTNGTITIAPLTPAGTYSVTYKICEVLNPTNCNDVTTTVTVAAAVIDAVADTFGPINGYTGSTTASVLANDTLNGVAVIPSQVVLTGMTVPTGLTLNTNGTITIAPLTPAGTYSVTYKICEVLNPTNCDSVTATVTVAAAVIDAVADTFGPINGYTGSTTASVLANDTLNGVAVVPSQVVLTGMTVPTGLTLNANGTITIGTLTPAGTYIVTYRICEVLNPTNCDSVTTTLTVGGCLDFAINDCDNDGENNGIENANGTNPNDPCSFTNPPVLNSSAYISWSVLDCDGDGVTNGQELTDGTDPTNPCESNPQHITIALSVSFLNGDCDGDGLTNEEEIGSNVNQPNDSNGNGIPDYLEVNNNLSSDDDLEIFNAVTPNGNGNNDIFVIRNIQNYPNNTVTIFNRWGVIVYETEGYGQNEKFFKGISEGRITINKNEELPVGTYFYILHYVNNNGVSKERSGYLYLNK
jgi:gliding motility-associated-like protein